MRQTGAVARRLACAVLLAAACDTSGREAAPPSAATLDVQTSQRAELRIVGPDTLSDAARVSAVAVESDGQAVAFIFSDSVRGVSSGLGLSTTGQTAAQLLWPDSVREVWWLREHALAFTTVHGARVVVDVHAARIESTEDASAVSGRPTPAPPSSDMMAHAVTFTDSLHLQPAGQPQQSSLRYRVVTLLRAPASPLGAFHVLASDSAGNRMNPAWFAIDSASGTATRIDEVVGPARELPETAAGWTETGRFIYAKGFTLWSADIVRRAR